jgi:hypothetical protein
MKHLLYFVLAFLLFSTVAFADTDAFQVTTDANGYVAAVDNVAMGTLTLTSFKSSHAFANAVVKVDGNTIFNAAVTANTTYNVTGAARSKFELIANGGPASTTVTITIVYTYSPYGAASTRFFSSDTRDTDAFELTTDGSGFVTATENVPFGTFTLKDFTCTHSFGNVQAKVDGKVIFDAAVTANTKYTVTGGVAKSKFELVASSGPANTIVTVTINYTFSPFLQMTGSRDTDAFQLTTDANGYVTATENVPFGTFTLSDFTCTHNFLNVQAKVDGKVVFNAAVSANTKYTVANGVAKKKFELIASGGPAKTTVTVNITYTYSPTRLVFSKVSDYQRAKLCGETDANGDLSIRDKNFEVPADKSVTVWGFYTKMAFSKMMLTLDGNTIFPEPVDCDHNCHGNLYLLNFKLEAGKHTLSLLAEGGKPECEVCFLFLYK